MSRSPIGPDLRAGPLRVPQRDELLKPGPYLVGRLGPNGEIRAVLKTGLSWLRACQLLSPLPDDYVMRIDSQWMSNSQSREAKGDDK